MELNADFTQRVVVRPADYHWRASPANGVDRMMLDRIGDEVARATTIVRFAPNSQFDSHSHDGGEEFLVLEGVFSDEHADYPAGTYVRNPIGTSHRPHIGAEGATILVKLWQFDETDTEQKAINTRSAEFVPSGTPGASELVVHDVPGEKVRLVRLQPGTVMDSNGADAPEELYVVEGAFSDEKGHYPAGTWMRGPNRSGATIRSEEGCLMYIKTGHLESLIGLDAASG